MATVARRERAPASGAYGRVADLIAARRCVVLDGGVGTEVARIAGLPVGPGQEGHAPRALIEHPDAIVAAHRAYLAAGCDVISTDTWGLVTGADAPTVSGHRRPLSWIDLARRALDLARSAVADSGREGESAVAFSLDPAIDSDDGREAIRLLARLFEDGPAPDLILVETLPHLRPSLLDAVNRLLDVGIPVWLSFRRCRHGLCGAYGEHPGGPEGDLFGRAAGELERLGVDALLVNCVPPDHVDGVVSYLRDFTDLPLGVYPNLGYLSYAGWRSEPGDDAAAYGEMTLRWRDEGAQIIGGCCGVGPEHIRAAASTLKESDAGSPRRQRQHPPPASIPEPQDELEAPWVDRRGRSLYPLAFPELAVEEGVAGPDGASLMAWGYLAREGIGAHQRCIDIGSGSGLLAIQLALNGARHVRAIDISPAAVANTSTNAYRNGVDDRIDAATVDLYPWIPEEKFDIVVANLDQEPADPLQEGGRWRADFWGRGPLDQLLAKLPDALAPDGVAYLVQSSILSQRRTAELLSGHGLIADVVDHSLVAFPEQVIRRRGQIDRIEAMTDAYHLRFGSGDAMVMYLLAVRKLPDQ